MPPSLALVGQGEEGIQGKALVAMVWGIGGFCDAALETQIKSNICNI